MLTIETLHDIQAFYKVTPTSIVESAYTIQEYTAECREYLRTQLPKEYYNNTWTAERKQKERDRCLISFVHEHPVRVKGFLTEQDTLNEQALASYIISVFNGEGILKNALEDANVDEIQINDQNTIYVVVHGVTQLLRDEKGNPVRFPDNDSVEQVITRLLNDGTDTVPNFTTGAPILNAKTAKKQYRLSAVHSSLNARDKADLQTPITTAVIRKFPDNKLTLKDLVKSNTITPKIAKLLSLLGTVNMNVFFVGETGSGKTTLMQAVAQSISHNDRVLCIQNPTEITFFERDATGTNLRNAVHWEANDALEGKNESKTSGTSKNLLNNALRFTPNVIILGEIRHDDEFGLAATAGFMGHRLLATYHSDSAVGALNRGAQAIAKDMQITLSDAKPQWGSVANVIIAQRRFPDGTRKIKEITEVFVDSDGTIKYHTILEYKYKAIVTDANGVKHMDGKYEMINPISERFRNLLLESFVPEEQFKEFLNVGDLYADNV